MQRLLSARASVEVNDRASLSPLYAACEIGFRPAATLLVSVGDADPHREGCATGESPIARLRRAGSSADALALAADLEALSDGARADRT